LDASHETAESLMQACILHGDGCLIESRDPTPWRFVEPGTEYDRRCFTNSDWKTSPVQRGIPMVR
jgi:hypothetical protein